jgi:hypothetical protein
VSRFEPYPLAVARTRRCEIRSSPVYAGHAIKPLRKLKSLAAGACSLGQDRGHPASRKSPARIPSSATDFLPFEQSMRMDRKGMISYRVEFSECAHRRASNGQHVRKRLFNESFPLCQALIRAIQPAWYFYQFVGKPPVQACLTPCGKGFPAKNASRLAITQSCIAMCDSMVWPPTWGVSTTLGKVVSASGACGSVA